MQRPFSAVIALLLLMDTILHDPKDPKLWELWEWVMQDFVHQP